MCTRLLRSRGGHPADEAERVALGRHRRVARRELETVGDVGVRRQRAERVRRHRREHALPDHHGAGTGSRRVPAGGSCRDSSAGGLLQAILCRADSDAREEGGRTGTGNVTVCPAIVRQQRVATDAVRLLHAL